MEGERPLCKCHGEPMKARTDPPGYWRCAVKARDADRRYRATNPKARERDRRYHEANPDKRRELNSRRIIVGGIYLGSFGFTDKERKALVDGTTD